jgi:formate/nitrite transporter FocA (FNT family)
MNGSALGKTALSIAATKCALSFGEAFFKGVLCNVLVCLAVWLAVAGRTVTDKVLAIVFPIRLANAPLLQ